MDVRLKNGLLLGKYPNQEMPSVSIAVHKPIEFKTIDVDIPMKAVGIPKFTIEKRALLRETHSDTEIYEEECWCVVEGEEHAIKYFEQERKRNRQHAS